MQNLYSLTGEMSLCRVSKLANSFAVTTCANLFEMWTRALESVSVLLKRVTYFLGACPCSSMLNIHIYIYIYEQGPPHPPPPSQMVPPPPCGRGGGFSQQPSHGVCSLYSAYNAYVSIIRMDILYVI